MRCESPNPYPHVSFTGFTTGQTTNSGFRIAPTWGEKNELQVTAGIDFHYIAQQIDELDKFENPVISFTAGAYDNFPVLPAKSYDPGLYFELKAPIEDDLTLTTGARIDLVSSNADGKHRTMPISWPFFTSSAEIQNGPIRRSGHSNFSPLTRPSSPITGAPRLW